MGAALISAVFALGLAMQSSAPAEQQKTTPAASSATAENKTDSPKQVQPVPAAPAAAGLQEVKRILVESFGDDAASKQIQAMVVTSLTDSKRFIVTENKDRADAILRGAGLEKTSQ